MVYINIKELLKEKGKTKYWLIKNMEGSFRSATIRIYKTTENSMKYRYIKHYIKN